MKQIHKIIALVSVPFLLIGCGAEQTTAPDPLVINTVEDQDDMLLTVIREDETVFQYEGRIQLWKGADGKAYGVLYLNEEVLQ